MNLSSYRMVMCLAGCVVATAAASGCSAVDSSANKLLMSRLGTTSFTVFPAYVRRGSEGHYDTPSARRLAALLREEHLGTAVVSEGHVPIENPWRMNQARMLRESAESFAAYLEEHPVDTEYALLPEFLMGRYDAGGMHAYLLDTTGRIAYAVLLNSHWEVFRYAMPETPADCTDVLMTVLRYDLRPANETD